ILSKTFRTPNRIWGPKVFPRKKLVTAGNDAAKAELAILICPIVSRDSTSISLLIWNEHHFSSADRLAILINQRAINFSSIGGDNKLKVILDGTCDHKIIRHVHLTKTHRLQIILCGDWLKPDPILADLKVFDNECSVRFHPAWKWR